MAEFCKCGSIIINGQCTNKNCTSATPGSLNSKAQNTAADSAKKKAGKSAKTRRASKCITYNLYEFEDDSEKEEDYL